MEQLKKLNYCIYALTLITGMQNEVFAWADQLTVVSGLPSYS